VHDRVHECGTRAHSFPHAPYIFKRASVRLSSGNYFFFLLDRSRSPREPQSHVFRVSFFPLPLRRMDPEELELNDTSTCASIHKREKIDGHDSFKDGLDESSLRDVADAKLPPVDEVSKYIFRRKSRTTP